MPDRHAAPDRAANPTYLVHGYDKTACLENDRGRPLCGRNMRKFTRDNRFAWARIPQKYRCPRCDEISSGGFRLAGGGGGLTAAPAHTKATRS